MFNVQANIVPSGNGRYVVNFGVVGEIPADLKGKLSVSRRPDHSFYAIQDIHKHTGSGPDFASKEDAQKLIDRVMDDVAIIVAGGDPSTNSVKVSRGPVALKYPTPPAPATIKVNNPPAAGAGVVGTASKAF